jgi:hypothetical protein
VGLLCASARADDVKTDQLTIPKGKGVVDAFVEINLSSDAAFKPVSITPDLWYGVTDDVTLGLVHSKVGATGVLGGVSDSLCLTGSSGGCGSFYPDAGADVRFRLKAPWTFDGGLYATQIQSPFHLDIKAGAGARWLFDKLAVEFQPNLFIAITDRGAMVKPNRDVLTVPGTASYPITPQFDVAGQLALGLPFEDAGSLFAFSLAVAGRFHPDPRYGVGLIFALPAVVGGGTLKTGFDIRTVTIGGSYAF